MGRTLVIAGLGVVVVVVVAAFLVFSDSDGERSGGAADPVVETDTTAANSSAENGQRRPRGNGARRGGEGSDAGLPDASETQVRRLERQRDAVSEMSEDEKKAQTVAQGFFDILKQDRGNKDTADFDTAGFCDLMSDEAREQTIDYARRSSGIAKEWDCESSVELLVTRSKRTGGFRQTRKARIVGVNAEGDRATATVRFGKGPLTSIPLVKQDGEWKLGTSLAAGRSGG